MLRKLKSFKNDIAPIGFYFDIFTTDLFSIPIMPIPMRIDKITNGAASLFILPNILELNQLCEDLDIQIDFKHFLSIGIHNLVSYAKETYKELMYKDLEMEMINHWFEKSKNIDAEILNLKNDFTFLISEFLKTYSIFKEKKIGVDENDYKVELIHYCDTVIHYFQHIIEKNAFKLVENESLIIKKIYRVKKEKYYPQIIPIKVKNLASNKIKMRSFVPYLIYEDILDCFNYNRQLLTENTQTPCSYNIWKDNNIILNLIDMKKDKYKEFSLRDINFKLIK